MANNKPPSTRSRAAPVAAQRPRSAMAKSTSSETGRKEGPETNIQVVIRCRRRSEREINDNSPIIVNTDGAKSNQIHVETSPPSSTLGIVTLPPIRTYPFDLVFGPEADQAMIYHEVVSPMLEQVVMGYNCTLFAYGQTGTGKTYTMQGDLVPSPMGNPSAHAGMIPRVLFRLFHHLETSVSDFSVKVSYVELYNEELRDLLANELPPPNGNTQSMGKDTNKHTDVGLKIFDEPNKRGVFIQGLEEIPVKDSKDALALLTKGSDRRQIAATKFNDHSSRSHSIFSITVHIKEAGVAGDDLLKIGKLNLVDLAGSENIGRSGAEHKRAREAGMINQSLLTLGRVINALVDKAQHVPYRESKLTRLLQDSLGGHTKTCIIATVSPARCNLEETLSTLDYALGARSIRNKPELNQRMTRNALLKEYIAEIERLKADLLAAREKNGIFFSEETWNQLTAEQELRQTEMEEAKRQVEIVENQMRLVREEFEQSIGLLMKRDAELKETRDQLTQKEAMLEETQGQLNVTKDALEEEIIVRQAFQDNEGVMNIVASGLKQVAVEGVRDVHGLFEKLDRKRGVLESNSRAVSSNGDVLWTSSQALFHNLEEFFKSSSRSISRLQGEAKSLEQKELQTLSSLSGRVEQQLQHVQDAIQLIQTHGGTEAEAVKTIQTVLKQANETFKTELAAWRENFKKTSAQMFAGAQSRCTAAFTDGEQAFKSIFTILESTIREVIQLIETEHQSMLQAQTLANEAADAEVRRLTQQNETLVRLLEAERLKADRAKDDLIQQFARLMGDYAKERDKGLRDAFGAIQSSNGKAQEEMKIFRQKYGDATEAMDGQCSTALASLEKRSSNAKRTRDGSLKNMATAKLSVEDSLARLQTSISESVDSYSTDVQKSMQDLHSSSSDAFERHSRAKRARMDITQSMTSDVQSELKALHRGIGSTSRDIESFGHLVDSESSNISSMTETYHGSAKSHLASMQQATRLLLEQGTKEDVPTGGTPRRRVWNYIDHWDLTDSRENILRARRGHVSESTTALLPVTKDDDAENMIVDEPETQDFDFQQPSMVEPSTTASLASSVSSSSSIPIPVPTKKVISKAALPLTDTRNVYTRPRRPR